MGRRRVLVGSLGVLLVLAWACTNGRNPNLVVDIGDSGSAGDADAGDDDGAADDSTGPGFDASTDPCFFVDEAAPSIELDPVALCVQEQALTAELRYAYTVGQGVAPGWSSTGSYAPLAGHDWQDDLGLAGSLGAFYCSAEVYGNTHSSAAFLSTLRDLGGVLLGELQQTPSPTLGLYDGEIYFRLRWAQAALQFVDNIEATTLDGLASAYGATLAGQAFAVAAGGGDGGSPGGTVIGTQNGDGSVAYAPAQTVMAAARDWLARAPMWSPRLKDSRPKGSGALADHSLRVFTWRPRQPTTGVSNACASTNSAGCQR